MNEATLHRQIGFTLIEILISVLIFAVAATLLFSSFRTFIITGETITTDLDLTDTIKHVHRRITLDLESLFIVQPPRYAPPLFNSEPDPYRFTGEEEAMGQGTVSNLSFASRAHIGFGHPPDEGIARISYYVKENETGSFDLYRSDRLLPASSDFPSCADPILCRNISGFEIIYTDHNGDEYNNWDSESGTFAHTIPVTVRFRIRLNALDSTNLQSGLQSGLQSDRQSVFETAVRLNTGRAPIE
ncbi:MAG: prepilin-type N-terminal cleavage/methylation domain-containing protein [Desulfobacterales bacterium]|nr:prepilin-type N-terminal cleavage/methylation domain-containing protein [Desulfobacterales bacterium]